MQESIIDAIVAGDSEELARIINEYKDFNPNYRNHYKEPTYLHLAVEKGYSEIVEILLNLPNIDPNLTTHDRSKEGAIEVTPLHLAIEYQHKNIIEQLIQHKNIDLDKSGSHPDDPVPLIYALNKNDIDTAGKLISAGAEQLSFFKKPMSWETRTLSEIFLAENSFQENSLEDFLINGIVNIHEEDSHGKTFLFYAAQEKNIELVKLLLQHGAAISDEIYKLLEGNNYGKKFLSYAVQEEDIKLVKLLLQHGAAISNEIYKLANKEISKLFNYKPGKGQEAIWQYCSKPNQPKAKQIILDFENTTDESSSEEITETEIANLTEEEVKQLKEEHKNCLNENDKEKLKIVVYRGTHYAPTFFTTKQKRIHIQNKRMGKLALSHATQKESGYEADTEADENHESLKNAHQKVSNFFHNLKKSKDKVESYDVSRNHRKFENLYYRFIQAYVESYPKLFGENFIQKDFDFFTKYNPAVSTTYLPDKAMKYASGMRSKQGKDYRLYPHYRCFTGKPKHPNVGFIDVFSIDIDYAQESSAFIMDLIQQNKIRISHIKQFECEILFESMIPGKFHIYREIFTFPSFKEAYHNSYSQRYGLSKPMYKKFQNEIFNVDFGNSSDTSIQLLDKIIESIVETKGKNLKNKIESLLFKSNPKHYIAYPGPGWKLLESPVSPKNKDDWKKSTEAEITKISDTLKNTTMRN